MLDDYENAEKTAREHLKIKGDNLNASCNLSTIFDMKKDSAKGIKVEKNYRAIGEWFVSEYEGEIPDAVKDVVAAVNASKARIAELEAQKAAAKADSEAPAEEVAEEAPVEEAPAVPTCPVCGAKSEGKFCPECGAPMNE